MLLGAGRLVNFGHGQMYMLGAFVTWFVVSRIGLPYMVAIPAAMVVGAAAGFMMQKTMLRLTMAQDLISIMIVTLGFGYVLQGAAALVFGSTARIFETPLSLLDVYIRDLWFTWQDIAIIVVTVVFFAAVNYVLQRTSIGHSVRMVAEDPHLAELSGVNVRRVYLGIFAFEGAAVALAAAAIAPRTPILTSMGYNELITTFVVVVLGGIGSVLGSYVAGLLLGLFTAFFGTLVSPAYTTAAAFAVLICVLVLRPGGFASVPGSR